MSKPIPIARTLAFAALVLSAACTDRTPTGAAGTPPDGREVLTQISCAVSVADRAVRCGDPAPAGGGAQDIILGGQDTYLRLESSNATYDSTSAVFSLDVSVQNLLALRMGTPDGTTATGTRVFFEQMPTATEGSGEVAVANADGTGNFTRIGQPYFAYPQILEPRGTSAPRTWRFDVPASVQRFRFTVYVQTQLAEEQGTLRWLQERGYVAVLPANLGEIWGAGPSSIFAVADSVILHDDGTGWQPMRHPGGGAGFSDVYGNSRYEVFAVGSEGTILEYDGNQWHLRARAPAGQMRNLLGVWSGGSDVYAVGWTSAGGQDMIVVARSHDGGDTWTVSTPAPGRMTEVWASGDHVYAAGLTRVSGQPDRCMIMHSADRGETWSKTDIPAPAACNLNAVSGTGPNDVIVAGGRFNTSTNLWEALLLRSTDSGATWQDTVIAGSNGRSVASLSPVPGGGMYAAGYRGTLLRRDGDTWTDLTSSPPPLTGTLFLSFTGVWAGSASNVHVVGFEARFRFDGSTWTRDALGAPTLDLLRSLHGSPGAVFAAGMHLTNQGIRTAVVMRNTGSGWAESFAAPADSTLFTGVWSAAADEAYAVGHQVLDDGATAPLGWRYAAGAWTEIALPASAAGMMFDAVTGTGPGAVTLLGHAQGATAGSTLGVLRSADGGESWAREDVVYTGTRTPTVAKAWTSGQEVWAVGYGGDVYTINEYAVPPPSTGENEAFLLHYDGQQWTLAEVVPGRVYRGVWSSGMHVYVTGYEGSPGAFRGFLRYSDDGGKSWTEFTAPASTSGGLLMDVWASSPSDVYVVGFGGAVLRFDGTRWLDDAPPTRAALYSVWGASAHEVYAVGERGLILHGSR
jgi:photosystem II stability/assembly factor-like uncharacterized protein